MRSALSIVTLTLLASVGCGSVTPDVPSSDAGSTNDGTTEATTPVVDAASDVETASDASVVDAAAPDATAPCNGPSVCTSGVMVAPTVVGTSSAPGTACIACHTSKSLGVKLAVGGTIYPTCRELDYCRGVAGVTVKLTGANAQTLSMVTNAAGNFTATATVLTTPYSATISFNGKERTAKTAHADFDCNGCHSAANGRLMAP